MRRFLLSLAFVGPVLTACASGAQVESAATTTTTPTPATVAESPSTTGDVAPVDEPTSSTGVPLPTGREALAAARAAGQPVVLWFWGAH